MMKGIVNKKNILKYIPINNPEPAPIKKGILRNTELDNALSELSKLYEDKGMVFYVQNGVIMAHKKMDVAVKNSGKKKHERSAKVDVKTQD